MKVQIVIVTMIVLCNGAVASPAYWTGIDLRDCGWNPYQGAHAYSISGSIHGENGHADLSSDLYGHVENGTFYLKHVDFSLEMDPTFNWWVLAYYGDVVGSNTFDSMAHVEDVYIGGNMSVGGTPVENPSDFYMAFKASEVIFVSGVGYEEGESWYGWVHVSVDDELNMTLLGEGINLYGEPVVVGMLPIPEPSAGTLLLLGLAGLALRRRR